MASRRPPRPLNSPPLSLCTYLSSVQASTPPLRTCNTPAHAPGAPLARSAAASIPRRRRVIAAAGEGQTPPPFFLSLLVRQGLTELVPPQLVDPEPSRSQIEDRQSATRPATVAKPPPSHPLRLRARLPLLRTVSNNPRSISLLLVHFGALTSSPERPPRPLPAPAVIGARAFPLSPLSRARVFLLRNASARG
jgi:hypothetical protein